MTFKLDGRTALVTGASQGIGEAVARRLAEQGARVVLAARNADKLRDLAAELGAGRAHSLPLDLTRPQEIAPRLQELPAEFAAVDILVNNAGITRDTLLLRMSLEQWQEVIDTNLTGAFAGPGGRAKGWPRRRGGRGIPSPPGAGTSGRAPRRA